MIYTVGRLSRWPVHGTPHSGDLQLKCQFPNIEMSNQNKPHKLSRLINKKKKLLYSKMSYVFQSEHEHYFDREEVIAYSKRHETKSDIDPCCKICGLSLSKYRNQVRFDTLEIPVYKDGK
jgi:hypothetical protein